MNPAGELVRELAVEPSGLRERIGASLAVGWRFAALYALDGESIAVLLTRGAHQLTFVCRAGGTVATIADLVPAARWDEREAHDLYGWSFTGHEPLRPLVEHPTAAQAWTAALHGRDANHVAVGPIHAGVIESGHFRFHVVGERILHLDLQLFYKHRGLERAAGGAELGAGLRFVQRACAADAVTNAVAYAHACEAALGLWPEAELARARTLTLELERLYNHLNDVSAVCAGVGFAAGAMLFAAFKERAQRVNERLVGHRFLLDVVAVGASALAIGAQAACEARAELSALAADVARGWRELRFAGSLQERLAGVGVLSRDDAVRLGAVGPSARAAGLAIDARMTSPRLAYESFAPVAPEPAGGDVAARFEQRGGELVQTLALLDELLGRPLEPARASEADPGRSFAAGVVESPRGQTVCCVQTDGTLLGRVHLRTGSYANWPALVHTVRDALLPDFPLINKSFELCYACVDR